MTDISYSDHKESFIERVNRYYKHAKRRGITQSVVHHSCNFCVPIYKAYKENISKNNSFTFQNNQYSYFIHKYSATWCNERAVEIPIFLDLLDYALSRNNKILEIGRVMNHYKENKGTWDVLDKYEFSNDTINEDVVSFIPNKKYDFIFSISTMEHVGFEEEPRNDEKIFEALDNVLNNMLAKNGTFIFSIPVGYNKFLDKQIKNNNLATKNAYFLKRTSRMSWKESKMNETIELEYGNPYYVSANGLAILSNKPFKDIQL